MNSELRSDDEGLLCDFPYTSIDVAFLVEDNGKQGADVLSISTVPIKLWSTRFPIAIAFISSSVSVNSSKISIIFLAMDGASLKRWSAERVS